MSYLVVSWVMEHSPVTGADRLVLLVIAEHAKDTGGDAYPSLSRIAHRARMDRRTAQRSIRSLVAAKAITVKENSGKGGTHRYRVILPKGWRDATGGGDTPPVTRRSGETPRAASDPSGGGDTPPEPSVNPSLLITPTGDRYETLRAVPATPPEKSSKRKRCPRHVLGNPTNENCGWCREDRLHDAKAAEDKRRADAERLAACPDCHGTGWQEHPTTGLPAGKCTTHLWRAS